VSLDAAGDFVVVWQSDGSSGTDSSGYSIQGQRHTISFFDLFIADILDHRVGWADRSGMIGGVAGERSSPVER
jgi:hypothetical protein